MMENNWSRAQLEKEKAKEPARASYRCIHVGIISLSLHITYLWKLHYRKGRVAHTRGHHPLKREEGQEGEGKQYKKCFQM